MEAKTITIEDLKRRVERVMSVLEESDLFPRDALELFVRTTDEFLLLREYRAMRSKLVLETVRGLLTLKKENPNTAL